MHLENFLGPRGVKGLIVPLPEFFAPYIYVKVEFVHITSFFE